MKTLFQIVQEDPENFKEEDVERYVQSYLDRVTEDNYWNLVEQMRTEFTVPFDQLCVGTLTEKEIKLAKGLYRANKSLWPMCVGRFEFGSVRYQFINRFVADRNNDFFHLPKGTL